MLHEFLTTNKADLIERCRLKVAKRLAPKVAGKELAHGIPVSLTSSSRRWKSSRRRNRCGAEGFPDPRAAERWSPRSLQLRRCMGASYQNRDSRLTRWFTTMAICAKP